MSCIEIGTKQDALKAAVLAPEEHADIDVFLNYVDQLSRSPELKNLFKTQGVIPGRPQRALYEFLYQRVLLLSKGEFLGERGTSCKTVIGCKGLGKTTALRNFLRAASVLFPSVVLLYITCEGTSDEFWGMPIVATIETVLKQKLEYAFSAPDFGDCDYAPLERVLEEKGKRLFLIIDEFDMLYQQDPVTKPSVTKTIAQLASIGNSESGLISVILSGSSAMLESLIRTNATSAMREEFPALKGAVNLNGTKYQTFRAPSSHPLDAESMKSIIETLGRSSDPELLNFSLFAAGTNPRAVQSALKATAQGLMSLDPNTNYSGQNTLRVPILRSLYDAIMGELVRTNESMLERMLQEEALDLEWIASGDWVEQFEPLSFEDVELLWESLDRPKLDDTKEDHYDLAYCLFHLFDRGWIVLDGVEHSHPKHVYPGTVMALFNLFASKGGMASETLDRYSKLAARFMKEVRKKAPEEVAKYVMTKALDVASDAALRRVGLQ